MLNIDNHIINYKRNAVADFCQINNYIYIYIYIYILYIYFFLFKTNQTILCLSDEITKQQKLYYFKMKNALLLIRFKIWFTIICKLLKLLCTIKHASSFKHKTTVLNFIVFYSIK